MPKCDECGRDVERVFPFVVAGLNSSGLEVKNRSMRKEVCEECGLSLSEQVDTIVQTLQN